MKKRHSYSAFILLATLFCLSFCLEPAQAQNADQVGKLFEKFNWRAIGPALMGGRTVDIEAVERQPWIIYAAVGPSGVWKSENAGTTWEPVFYKESTVSVGDIAIAQSSPNIIWAGSGEATCRNSVTVGDGVYKSTDGGKTWTNMGLKETRHISRIIVNRGDPNIVYVAAMGHLWGPNPDRGIYKTIDGGKTWKKVLYVNENTGFADLVLDYSDSQILYAAAYEHRRLPYIFTSGGPGSGLYKSSDGGESWKRLDKDLPQGVIGRIGLDVSRSNPNVVYALIEHKEGAVFRSEDKGESWKRMSNTETFKRVNNRPFYYSQVRVDPNNDKVIYVLSSGLFVSEDMGQKFRAIGAGIHSDHHALWIDPNNSLHLLEGNDGGIALSWDAGKNWQAIKSLDLAEVYQVGFDMRNPYYVYCGLQDNGAWGGPSASLETTGILNSDWYMVSGGDGFYVQPDPKNSDTIYANYQMNNISRFNLKIGKSKSIRPAAPLKEPPYRFNWNSPIHISPHDSKVVYCGGNYLFRTTDGGATWNIISPDLTTNDPQKQKDSGGPITPDNSGAEIHCTIVTISESPVQKGLIWCGMDDGNVQMTQDDGKTWTNVILNVKGLPPNTWCSRIEASHFEAGTAYAAFDGHRTDDYAPYVFKTNDFGKTWKPIKSNLPAFGWVHVIREDLKNKNLLFVGTEFGIFASLDGGASWFSLKNNLPTVAVNDIAIHPRENDLIVGTHGRGIWILDDAAFLQEMTPQVQAKDFYLFGIRPVTAFLQSSTREPFGKPAYAGKNPPYGMLATAYIKAEPKEVPKITISDAKGKMFFESKLQKKAGIQRETWNLTYAPETKDGRKLTPTGVVTGFSALPAAPAGEYSISLDVAGQKVQKSAKVDADPRIEFKDEDRTIQTQTLARLLTVSQKSALAVTAVKNIGRQFEKLDQDLKKLVRMPEPFLKAVDEFKAKEKKLEDEIVPKEFLSLLSRELALRGGSISQLLLFIGMSVMGYPGPPTATELSQLKEIEETVESQVSRANEFIKTDMPKFNDILKQNKIPLLAVPAEVKF
jgi:photosystem II stability/assembly factor-like uncharacterized protein